MQKKKVIFMGTPLIAMKALEVLNKQYDVVLVVIQPDRKKDRKGNFVFSEVKEFCINNHLNYLQPEKVGAIKQEIIDLNPDLIVTCAFGQFVPESILNIPKYKSVNIHASLLPQLRGGAPIQWSIINGNKKTGLTLMYMDKKMDHGNIIAQTEINMNPDEITYSILYQKMIDVLPEFITNNFEQLFNEKVNSIAQDETKATFGLNINKQDRYIDWNKEPKEILHLVNGLCDVPLALTIFNNLEIKIKKVHAFISNQFDAFKNGEIIEADQNELLVKCNHGYIQINELQLPNKNMMSYQELQKGNKLFLKGLFFQNITVNS